VQAKVKWTYNWISDALARTWEMIFFKKEENSSEDNKGGNGPGKLQQLVEQSVCSPVWLLLLRMNLKCNTATACIFMTSATHKGWAGVLYC